MKKMVQGKRSPTRIILVTGDVTVDWNIARAQSQFGGTISHSYVWASGIETRACSHPGGAALITQLLEALCAKYSGKYSYEVEGKIIGPRALQNASSNRYARFYSIWTAREQHGKDTKAWRVSEFCGRDIPDPDKPYVDHHSNPKSPWAIVINDTAL